MPPIASPCDCNPAIQRLLQVRLALAQAHGNFVVELDGGVGREWHDAPFVGRVVFGQHAGKRTPEMPTSILPDFRSRSMVRAGDSSMSPFWLVYETCLLLQLVLQQPVVARRLREYPDLDLGELRRRQLQQIIGRLQCSEFTARTEDQRVRGMKVGFRRGRDLVALRHADDQVTLELVGHLVLRAQRVAHETHALRKERVFDFQMQIVRKRRCDLVLVALAFLVGERQIRRVRAYFQRALREARECSQ